MREVDPRAMKKFGRQVRNFDPTVWGQCCEGIVERGNYEKVKVFMIVESKDLKILLLSINEQGINKKNKSFLTVLQSKFDL